ncbi:hypothetical protein VE03_05458 [Pseudogymnoascus sp. 23342-1-I1]|nr:hypothetical protein VE03_05458 [Pseudogymnoascus sp. 23342-1-I1]
MSRSLDQPSPTSLTARNIFIYNHDGRIVGGLWQNGSITNSTLYEMCSVFIITTKQFGLFRLNGDGSTSLRLFPNRALLSAGSYIILSTNSNPISMNLTQECALRRVTTEVSSSKITPRTQSFHDRVIARDNQCDGYKIICLSPDILNIDGRTLSLCCRDPQSKDRVPGELLRWHYRQAILANMKGEGEKPWNTHFYDEMDTMGGIMEGPDAAERMEVELFTRLGAGELHYSASPEVGSP